MPEAVGGLIGRERELARVDGLLRAAREGRGGVLGFSGEPGSGKTSLLRAARERAQGFRVLSCTGVEWEAELPFSALHELLMPILEGVDALPAPQREAIERALGFADTGATESIHAYVGTMSLLLEATRDRPVLVLIDDVQWLDAASAQAIAFATRRVGDEPIAVLTATRPGGRLAGIDEPEELAPLDLASIGMLAERELGSELPTAALELLERATAGNPLAVLEATRHAGSELRLLTGDLEEPLPVGDLIERGFSDRLDPLSADARKALELIAATVTGRAAVITAALRKLGIDPHTLGEAEEAGVLEHDEHRWLFAHPVLRSIVHRRTSALDRQTLHRVLGEVETDAAARAWHLAAATREPDAEVADTIAEAARAFERRGGGLAAAKALRRAAELTPDPDVRAERFARAARTGRFAGAGSEWVLSALQAAQDGDASRKARAAAEIEYAVCVGYLGGDRRGEGLLETARRVAEFVPDQAVIGLRVAATDWLLAGDGASARQALSETRALVASGRVNPEVSTFVEAEILLAAALLGETDRDELVAAAEREYHRLRGGDSRSAEVFGGEMLAPPLAEALIWAEEFELAQRVNHEYIRLARAQGRSRGLGYSLFVEGQTCFRLGRWSASDAAFQEAYGLVDAELMRSLAVSVLTARAILDACRGDSLAPLAGLEQEAHDVWGLEIVTEYIAVAEAYAALGAGDVAEAVAQFERAWAWKQRSEQVEPCMATWPVDRAEALIEFGRRDEAQRALERLREYAERYDRAWARAGVVRIEALLASDDDFAALFETSLALYPAARSPFDEARTRLSYGRRLRRARRPLEARAQLETALAAFEALGARPWSEQTRRELIASGGAPPSPTAAPDPDALTPAERQVAALVAGGASNKEAAGQLFLSPKTIEAHLSRIYRKLGVSSRTQLAARWGELGER